MQGNRARERGQALIEFAMSFLVLLGLGFGAIEIARAFLTAQIINEAARTVARTAASTPGLAPLASDPSQIDPSQFFDPSLTAIDIDGLFDAAELVAQPTLLSKAQAYLAALAPAENPNATLLNQLLVPVMEVEHFPSGQRVLRLPGALYQIATGTAHPLDGGFVAVASDLIVSGSTAAADQVTLIPYLTIAPSVTTGTAAAPLLTAQIRLPFSFITIHRATITPATVSGNTAVMYDPIGAGQVLDPSGLAPSGGTIAGGGVAGGVEAGVGSAQLLPTIEPFRLTLEASATMRREIQ